MNLADPQALKAFLERHRLFALKGLGQHFLCSQEAVDAIVSSISGCRGVLEIGPGPGVLTSALTDAADHVVALEIDRGMLKALQESAPSAQIVIGDALKTNLDELLEQLPQPRAVVANMPYYITAPLIDHIAASRSHFDKAVLMMQKEVAERIQAGPGDGKRGSLSVYLQALFEIRKVALVSAAAFMPPPKVDSMVLEFVAEKGAADPVDFFKFVREGFSQPRKTLANSLATKSKSAVQAAIKAIGEQQSVRPHELRLEDWRALYSKLGP